MFLTQNNNKSIHFYAIQLHFLFIVYVLNILNINSLSIEFFYFRFVYVL